MKYSYVARQPILDRKKSTIGYELLFRDGPKNTFPDIDPEEATSRLLSDHFLTAHYSTLGDLLGFVNFPYQSLLNMVPTLFPIKSMVVEILEDCPPTPELLSAIKKWLSLGTKLHWMILSQAMIGKLFYLISPLSNLIFVSCYP